MGMRATLTIEVNINLVIDVMEDFGYNIHEEEVEGVFTLKREHVMHMYNINWDYNNVSQYLVGSLIQQAVFEYQMEKAIDIQAEEYDQNNQNNYPEIYFG